jgi:hypothetical protein
MTEHVLKCWPDFFTAVYEGVKPFEVRKNDRDFRVGDCLILREFDPVSQAYSGRETKRFVRYVLQGGGFGIAEDHVVMGLGVFADD